MSKIKKYFKDGHKCGLESIVFKNIDNEDEVDDLFIQDAVEVLDLEDSVLSLRFTRHVTFLPENIFDIVVSLIIERDVKGSAKLEKNDFDKMIREMTDEELQELGGSAFNRLSLMIAQITSIDRSCPLITAPVPYLEQEEENR